MDILSQVDFLYESLSARRAWIEIIAWKRALQENPVALRKESVDRNLIQFLNFAMCCVALRKESVDRNIFVYLLNLLALCRRSPQGERG